MNTWRTWQNYLLLSAFALKILVLGTLLTLAIHNICLTQLLNNDVSWCNAVYKQHKRNNEDPSSNSSFAGLAAMHETDGSSSCRRLLQPPVVQFLKLLFPLQPNTLHKNYHTPDRYLPEKIFIRHCVLRR